MDAVTIDTLTKLARANAWIPLIALVVGAIIRIGKNDPLVAKIPLYFKPEHRAYWALGLSIIGAALDRVATGGTWYDALAGGLVAGSGAIAGHEVIVNGIRKGRDLGIKKEPPVPPPPPNDWDDDSIRPPSPQTVYPSPKISTFPLAGAAVVLAMFAALASCSAIGPACRVIDLADKACELIPVRMPDGSIEYVPKERLGDAAMRIRLERIRVEARELDENPYRRVDGGAQ
jgi:hypothetical protein